jgi:hypothetical protein
MTNEYSGDMSSRQISVDLLIEALPESLKLWLEQNRKPPFLVAAVGLNDRALIARYASRGGRLEATVRAKHCEDDTFTGLVFVVIIDGNGVTGYCLVRPRGSH